MRAGAVRSSKAALLYDAAVRHLPSAEVETSVMRSVANGVAAFAQGQDWRRAHADRRCLIEVKDGPPLAEPLPRLPSSSTVNPTRLPVGISISAVSAGCEA
jgi:hypothetical protein